MFVVQGLLILEDMSLKNIFLVYISKNILLELQTRFGQERLLRLHLGKKHDDSTDCRFDINIYGKTGVKELFIFFVKFDMVKSQ